jgi:hypothetical protein
MQLGSNFDETCMGHPQLHFCEETSQEESDPVKVFMGRVKLGPT